MWKETILVYQLSGFETLERSWMNRLLPIIRGGTTSKPALHTAAQKEFIRILANNYAAVYSATCCTCWHEHGRVFKHCQHPPHTIHLRKTGLASCRLPLERRLPATRFLRGGFLKNSALTLSHFQWNQQQNLSLDGKMSIFEVTPLIQIYLGSET